MKTIWLTLGAVLFFSALATAGNDPNEAAVTTRIKAALPDYAEAIVSDPRFMVDPSLLPRPRTGQKTPKRSFDYLFTPWALERGAKFLSENKMVLRSAEEQFGVPKEFIAALFGIETEFGKGTGRSNVLVTLYTFAVLRPNFIQPGWSENELILFLRLCQRNGWDPFAIKGSRTGALGKVQFEPSSYWNLSLRYKDGRCERRDAGPLPDLWDDADAICSAANYLRRAGWGTARVSRVKALWSYNHDRAYGRAVIRYAGLVQKPDGSGSLLAKRSNKKAARK